jgi:hypothetical protein
MMRYNMAEEDMKRETDQIDYVILGDAPAITLEGEKVSRYQERKDREAQQLVESTLLQISREKARFSLLGPKNVFDRNGFTSDRAIAELLAKEVPIDDAAVEKHEITSEEDFTEDATTTCGKAFIEAESTSDPVIKSRLENFVKKIVKETSAFLAEPKKKALGAVAIVATVATACSAKVPPTVSPVPEGIKTQTSQVLPTQAPPTETATQAPTPTETATATENPAENANPFDRSTFPAEFQKDPATMTKQEQTDYQTFLNSARENFIKDQGIQDKVDQMKASGKLNNKFLDLMAMFYAQNNPDQLKNPELAKGKDVVVGPAEIRDILIDNDNNVVQLWSQGITDNGKWWLVDYGWVSADWLGPNAKNNIFGVDTKIQYADEGISGVLGGISSIDNDPNTKVLWIIVKNNDIRNNLDLVPRMVKVAPDFTLSGSEGATCRVGWEGFKLNEMPEGVPFGPLEDAHSGKPWTSDSLYSNLGRPVTLGWRSDSFQDWAIGDNSKFSINISISLCYVYGLPVEGNLGVNPYFSPQIWNELVPAN